MLFRSKSFRSIFTVFLLSSLACLAGVDASAQAPTPVPTPSLDPATIPKYTDQLVIPPAMPKSNKTFPGSSYIDYYEIGVRQFQQNILPVSMDLKSTVWSYGAINTPATFNYPAFTIEATVNKPVRVKWINQLVDAKGNYLPHLFAVDQTLHWANPNGLMPDMHGNDPNPYRGPVPLVTHLHGAHVGDESDGYPEAWFLPNAKNIPKDYFKTGSFYDTFKQKSFEKFGVCWEPGSSIFQYPNTQNACTLWYHDHALGMTRLNVYAGPAGFYNLRGGKTDLPAGVLPGPAPMLGDKTGKKYFEMPIVIQDRSFNSDGSLFFPDSRQFFDGIASPYAASLPLGPIAPIWNPEFFGNTIVVNGKTWPNLNVEPRRYRFRLLDGCNARSLKLKLVIGNPADPIVRSGPAALPFWQIGAEQGFLPAPVQLDTLLITLAERADVIVDFSKLPPNTQKVYMINIGPDAPLNGMEDSEADPNTTGQVMQFTLVPLTCKDTSTPPDKLKLPVLPRLGKPCVTRQLTLNEVETIGQDINGNFIPGPAEALLGVMTQDGRSLPLHWMEMVTENPKLNATEIWAISNFTGDAHPIHVHLVAFEVVDRTPLGDPIGGPTTRGPEVWETGPKDTVLAYPGEVTRIKAKFDMAGRYVWHCHIIDHEDNEMMRPYQVVDPKDCSCNMGIK